MKKLGKRILAERSDYAQSPYIVSKFERKMVYFLFQWMRLACQQKLPKLLVDQLLAENTFHPHSEGLVLMEKKGVVKQWIQDVKVLFYYRYWFWFSFIYLLITFRSYKYFVQQNNFSFISFYSFKLLSIQSFIHSLTHSFLSSFFQRMKQPLFVSQIYRKMLWNRISKNCSVTSDLSLVFTSLKTNLRTSRRSIQFFLYYSLL